MSMQAEEDKLGHDSEAIAGFLPLVDVILAVLCVALVFFGETGLKDISVRLPETDSRTSQMPADPIIVQVDKCGRMSITNDFLTHDQLFVRLQNKKSGQPVLLAAHPEATYAVVADLLQRLNTGAVTDVRLLFNAVSAKQ